MSPSTCVVLTRVCSLMIVMFVGLLGPLNRWLITGHRLVASMTVLANLFALMITTWLANLTVPIFPVPCPI